jgi:hypothetical protein
MSSHPDISHPPDICLLLRAHGEQRWLISELVPVLRQLEQPCSLPEDQRDAALAYLEVLWLDAHLRAADTDSAYAKLDAADTDRDRVLYNNACRYHAAVRRQRDALGRRVARLTWLRGDAIEREHASA